MDPISFRCPSCDRMIKAPAEKAGRKVKCGKCGKAVVVPEPEKKDSSPLAGGEGVGAGYGLVIDPAEEAARLEAQKDKGKKKAAKQPAHKITIRLKNVQEPERWRKVSAGLNLVLISIYIWAGALALQWLVLVLGMTQGPEYSSPAEKILVVENQPEPGLGETESINLPAFLVALVAGEEMLSLAKGLLIFASVLGLAQAGTAIAGYSICLTTPDRFGTRGQVKTLLTLASINILLNLIFKLLPLVGAMNYALVPWFIPELTLIDAGTDRGIPIHIFWSKSGFWEMLLSILVMFTYYAEPMLIGVFLWSLGLFLREPPVEEAGFGVVQITMGVAFTLLGFLLFSVAGTSPVLLIVLRIGYGLWVLFSVILLIRLAMAILKTRSVIAKYVDAAEEAEESGQVKRRIDDDDDEEDDEEEIRPRKKRRRDFDDEDDD